MDIREKLVDIVCDAMEADGCIGHCNHPPCFAVERVVNALIAHGVTVQEWISVKDRLPEEMGKYVCRYVFGEEEDYPFEQVLWYYPQLEKPHFQHEGSMGLRVTHWMPLPQPPQIT